jgi:formyltetrahydrofolate deformylase
VRLVLLLSCADRPGIVASVSRWIVEVGGNIVEADQHTDVTAGLFLQRIEFDAALTLDEARASFRPIADEFSMTWSVHPIGVPSPIVVLGSIEAHCVYDLLSRIATGEFPAACLAIVSNHPDLRVAADRFGVPFHCLPVDDTKPSEQEGQLLSLLDELAPELVVLARYMRILSPTYVASWGQRTINIHHSFLPAFAGARPYRQAYARGVKVIGATAHYVTEDLDEGPIIAQGVTEVSHRDDIDDLRRRGRDMETVVLARAVRQHLEHRVIAYANRTVVFD